MPGPDHRASADPADFATYVEGIRTVERALGRRAKRMVDSEVAIAAVARRSVVTLSPVFEGELIAAHHLGCRRPGIGLSPSLLPMVVGRRAARDIPVGTILDLTMLT